LDLGSFPTDGSISVAAIIFCWAFLPELKGRSLEQIDYMFEHGVPVSLTARHLVKTSTPALTAFSSPSKLRKMGTYVFDDTLPQTAQYTEDYQQGKNGSFADVDDKKQAEFEHVQHVH
jgi:hypothetical protein